MEHVRVDDGYEEGMDIPIFYDPLIAKLIAWGTTREEAIRRLIDAIDGFDIEGVATTLPFGKFVLQHEAFTSGHFDTHFVQHYFTPDKLYNIDEAEIAAALALKMYLKQKDQLIVPLYGNTEWSSKR